MPQSQFYEQNWNNHLYSSHSRWGYNAHESYSQPPYQHSALYTYDQDSSIEENSESDKMLEELERRLTKLENSWSRKKNLNLQNSYSICQSHHNK